MLDPTKVSKRVLQGYSLLVDCLPGIHEALGSLSSTAKNKIFEKMSNLKNCILVLGRHRQEHYHEFQDRKGYPVRLCLKTNNINRIPNYNTM